MAKRLNSPLHDGDRKKARLDISVHDHNFPLSQNADSNKATDPNDWAYDIDDEILLQLSQACDQNSNSSILPEYSQFRPPVVTSTQQATSSSPKSGAFSFKRPSTSSSNIVSTHLKDKCQRISSPLRGISTNIQNELIDLTGDYFNEPVLNKDTDDVYRQLFTLKEENAKLKSENGKLLEKCVTKEGESSILRAQLKTYQVAVDSARLEKIRTQEQAQMQWSAKLDSVNNKLHELRTELDFKNMEIINMKEKCKMLESNKIKLTQITVAGKPVAKLNNSSIMLSNIQASQLRRVSTATSGVQTDNKPQFLKLTKTCRFGKTNLTQILPLITGPATEQQYSILDYNEKLKNPTDMSPNKCRIFSSFHKLLSSTNSITNKSKNKINLNGIYEELMCITASDTDVEKNLEHYINVFNMTKSVLEDVQAQLETVTRRITSAFQKEMDKKYLECTTAYIVVEENDLIGGKALYNEEQAILARRMTAVLQSIVKVPKVAQIFNNRQKRMHDGVVGSNNKLIDLLHKICILLDDSSCGVLYSGLLLSVLLLIENLMDHSQLEHQLALSIVKRVVSSRTMLFVMCPLFRILNKIKNIDNSVTLCTENDGSLQVDYEQGVLLYDKDSCLLQLLLKQVESSLKCMETQNLPHQVVETTQCLIQYYSYHNSSQHDESEKPRCECNQLLMQVMVYSLNICSTLLCKNRSTRTENMAMDTEQTELLRVCRSGLQILYKCSITDVEYTTKLSYNEGNLIEFYEQMSGFDHDGFHSTMLSELLVPLQAVAEEATWSFHRQAWLRSFDNFSITD
ncbi:uncharacterized protein [Epargyreus clarus]|uniref:uncharacterized protein n=1 Tax=Epargyreus clarus TaxID=520877 RepID=UPI003C2ACCAA